MSSIVSITSQGQISIPAKIRRELGLNQYNKAFVKKEKDRIIIEPIPDLLSLRGALKHKAKQGMSIDKIIKMEKEVWEKAAVKRYLKTV